MRPETPVALDLQPRESWGPLRPHLHPTSHPPPWAHSTSPLWQPHLPPSLSEPVQKAGGVFQRREAGESHKLVLFQSHHLPRQAAAMAAVTPRSSDKEGAEWWEFLPPCSEAINPSFIPALRLPRVAHVCPAVEVRACQAWHTPAPRVAHTGQMASQDPGPHTPLSRRKRLNKESRTRRARGLSKERNGGGGWEAINAGPERGLHAVAAGSHGQYGGQTVSGQKVGTGWAQQTRAGKPPRRLLQGYRRVEIRPGCRCQQRKLGSSRGPAMGRPVPSPTHTIPPAFPDPRSKPSPQQRVASSCLEELHGW